jgi:hypothetical protein
VARKMGKCFCRSLQLFFSDTSRLIWFCLKAWSGENRVHGILQFFLRKCAERKRAFFV